MNDSGNGVINTCGKCANYVCGRCHSKLAIAPVKKTKAWNRMSMVVSADSLACQYWKERVAPRRGDECFAG